MGEEDLEAEIADQAEERSAALVDRAERIARRIERQAARHAEEIRTEAEKALAPRREAETVRQISLADLEVRRETAARRERLVRQVLDEARQRLKDWRRRPRAKDAVARLVGEAVEVLGGDSFKVELDPGDGPGLGKLAGEMSKRLGRKVELELVRAEALPSGGARVTSADGRSRVDQTFEARLERLEPDLRRLIHEELFARPEDREPKT